MIKNTFTKNKLAKIISTSCLLMGASVYANPNAGIEKIEVTAQKRTQNIQEVPIAITAFSGEMIANMGLNTSTDLAEKTPNLTIGQPTGEGGVVAVVMRGVGLSDFAPNNQAPIGLYVDGVVAGNSNAQITTMFDVERVEVLKGPQGTLYGRNTTGGTINVVSKKPTSETEGYVKVNLGNEGLRKVEGVFNTSVAENLNVRLAVVDYHLDGYMENLVTGNEVEKENTAFRFLADWKVNDELSILFNLHGNDNDSDADLYNSSIDEDFYKGTSEFDPKISTETIGGSVTIEGELSDTMSFTSITSYDDLEKRHQEDADMLPIDLITNEYNPDTETFSQEFHINGDYETGHWILGVFYGKDKIDYHQSVRVYGDAELIFETDFDENGTLEPYSVNQLPGFFWNYNNNQELETMALFGQVDHKLTSDVELTLGLRVTKEEVELDSMADLTGVGIILPAELGGLGIPAEMAPDLYLPGYYAVVGANEHVDETGLYSDKVDDTQVSGKIGINWQVSNDMMLFASANRGFKGGGLNGNFVFNPDALSEFDSETINAYEVGIKSDLFSKQLRFNGSAFYYDYQDAQLFNNAPDPVFGLPAQRVINSDVSLYGLDAELNWAATEAFSMQASVGYVHSEYDENPIDPVTGELPIKGNQLQNAPEFSASMIANYEWYLDSGRVNAMLDMSFTDKTYFSPYEDDAIAMGSYTLTNFRLAWTDMDDIWGVALWGKNLTDKEVKTYSFDLRADFGFVENMRGAPRTFGIEVTYNFY